MYGRTPGFLAALAERYPKTFQQQFFAQVVHHRPADDLAAPCIHEHGEIEEAAYRRYEGEVGDPKLVWPRRREVAIDEVGRRMCVVVPPRHPYPATAPAGTNQSGRPLQPRDAFVYVALPAGAQFSMHLRRGLGFALAGVQSPHPLQRRRIGERMRRRRPPVPGVVAGLRHAEHARHRRNWEGSLVRAHELEDPDGTTP